MHQSTSSAELTVSSLFHQSTKHVPPQNSCWIKRIVCCAVGCECSCGSNQFSLRPCNTHTHTHKPGFTVWCCIFTLTFTPCWVLLLWPAVVHVPAFSLCIPPNLLSDLQGSLGPSVPPHSHTHTHTDSYKHWSHKRRHTGQLPATWSLLEADCYICPCLTSALWPSSN